MNAEPDRSTGKAHGSVSIVIPCFNQGQYLSDSVGSAVAQTIGDCEIIVVNDGSTEGDTLETLDELRLTGVKVVHTPNAGLAAARNTGIACSGGEFVLPLDADDRIAPEYAAECAEVLHRQPTVGIVYAEAEYFGDKCGRWPLLEFSLPRMLLSNMIYSSAMFRKADWVAAGGYNTGLRTGWEDWEFWLSILGLGRSVVRLPDVRFFYRYRRDSMVRSMSDSDRDTALEVIVERHSKLYGENLVAIIAEARRLEEELSASRIEHHRIRRSKWWRLREHAMRLIGNAENAASE